MLKSENLGFTQKNPIFHYKNTYLVAFFGYLQTKLNFCTNIIIRVNANNQYGNQIKKDKIYFENQNFNLAKQEFLAG